MKKLNNKKGFTLAELLIVVAIIAVLVAISIPIFSAQLEKAREATDLANVRSAYAEQVAAYLTWDGTSTLSDIEVPVKQTQANWQSYGDASTALIAEGKEDEGITVPAKTTGTYTVSIDTSNGTVSVN